MCTAMTLESEQEETFFGRTMDFSHDIQPELYIVPKDYMWKNLLDGNEIFDTYRFIGIGQKQDDILAFFDGVNEEGFAAAALYFSGYAKYNNAPACIYSRPIAAFDFLHYILGRCSSIKDLKTWIQTIAIIGLPDPVTQTIAPLHWIVVDKTGACAVIEQTNKGLQIFDNPIGVMTNSPDFEWHMTNLRNYVEVSPKGEEEVIWGNVLLQPFGQGGGTMLLPGGYTAPERFVRTAFLKTQIPKPKSRLDAIVSCFHSMESVSIPRGAVITSRNTYDYTKYTAFINTNTGEYFFKTYDNIQITTASLFDKATSSTELLRLGKLEQPMLFNELRKQNEEH